MAISVIAFVGFARNYYLRLWLGTRPISLMVHIHGLVMTARVLLFLIQTLLVSKQRVDLHRKLGVAGAVLSAIVLGLGVYTIVGSIERQNPGVDAKQFGKFFIAFDGISLLLFAGLVLTALIQRQRRQTHKRLMLVAMISLLPPAFGRLVTYFTHENVEVTVLGLMCSIVLMCVVADRLRNHRFYPPFVYGGMLVLASNVLT